MGLFDYLFSKADAKCDICVKSFAQMWASYRGQGHDTALGDEAYRPRTEPLPTKVPGQPARLVAIGDIHGDYHKAVRALRLAGLMDEHGSWAGGSAVAVQVGDILDRGDHEIRILILLERLAAEAAAAGGRLYLLNGNHETMNVMGDHRYATPGANLEFLGFSTWRDFCALMKRRSGCDGAGAPDPLQVSCCGTRACGVPASAPSGIGCCADRRMRPRAEADVSEPPSPVFLLPSCSRPAGPPRRSGATRRRAPPARRTPRPWPAWRRTTGCAAARSCRAASWRGASSRRGPRCCSWAATCSCTAACCRRTWSTGWSGSTARRSPGCWRPTDPSRRRRSCAAAPPLCGRARFRHPTSGGATATPSNKCCSRWARSAWWWATPSRRAALTAPASRGWCGWTWACRTAAATGRSRCLRCSRTGRCCGCGSTRRRWMWARLHRATRHTSPRNNTQRRPGRGPLPTQVVRPFLQLHNSMRRALAVNERFGYKVQVAGVAG